MNQNLAFTFNNVETVHFKGVHVPQPLQVRILSRKKPTKQQRFLYGSKFADTGKVDADPNLNKKKSF